MTIEERLSKLEKENRRLRVVGGTVCLLLVAAVSMGQAAGSPTEVIEAQRFVLVAEDGERKAELRAEDDGSVQLELLNKKGRVAARLAVSSTGKPGLFLRDKFDNDAVELSLEEEKGWPLLQFRDSDGADRIRLWQMTTPPGFCGFTFRDAKGSMYASLHRNALTLYGPDQAKDSIGLSPYGLNLRAKGLERMRIGLAADGGLLGADGVGVVLRGTAGQDRFAFGMDLKNRLKGVCTERGGQLLWKFPGMKIITK